MAAFILLGAKIGSRFGSRGVFQIAVAIHGARDARRRPQREPRDALHRAGVVGCRHRADRPGAHRSSSPRTTTAHSRRRAIGFLAAAIPAAGVLALLLAGWFANTIGWRWSFVLMVALAVVNLLLSFRLKRVPAQPGLTIDWTGAILAADRHHPA